MAKNKASPKRSSPGIGAQSATAASSSKTRRRGPKPYPVMTFDEALTVGRGIMEHGAGHPMKRVTLLQKLKLADSHQTRNLITNSGKYGITVGGYQAEQLRLTDKGREAVDLEVAQRKNVRAQFELAIDGVEHFNKLYDQFKRGKLPVAEVLRDALTDLDAGDRSQCVDIFISNAKTVGILQTREGAEQLLAIDEYLDELPASGAPPSTTQTDDAGTEVTDGTGEENFDTVCFFIAPIGDDGSEHRQHSDAILSSFVEPALAEHRLKVVRADKISKPGMISAQIIEYIIKSKLVVADLSFHNPNVFYELSLRHATGKPTVHLIRESDKIPFDVGNFRTIPIKMDSVYSVLAKLETYRAEIAQQIRQVLADGLSTNNPILTYCPSGRFVVDGSN